MKALREVWGQTVTSLADERDDILMLDADVANSTKSDIFAERHPDRFIQLGIAEQNMIGVAVGLSAHGFVPWLSSFSVFLTHRAIDPIRMLVAQAGSNVKMAGAYAGLLTGGTGRTHQDVEDIAILRAMPGLVLLAPGDPAECAAMVRWATEHTGPVYLRLSRDAAPDVFDDSYAFELGRVHTLREGEDIAMVSTGTQTPRTLEAAALLEADGISARVIHVPTLKPHDDEGLQASLQGVRLVVTTEEHSVIGGLGGLVAESLADAGAGIPLLRIGLADVWTESAPNSFLLDKYGLSAERVAERIRARLL